MLELFYQGGLLFMSILTLIFLTMPIVAFKKGLSVFGKDSSKSKSELREGINYIKAIGLFALIIGVLGQLIGLYSAFATLEGGTSISSPVMAGGLRVSMITTLYGWLIYIVSYLIWLLLSWRLR